MDGQNQNIHCKQVWVAVAMVVAVEILAAAKRGGSPSIGIGGFLLAPLNALEAFLRSKLQSFVGAFASCFDVVGERRDALLASDLMRGGVEKIKNIDLRGGRSSFVKRRQLGGAQVCRCEGPLLQLASKRKPTSCWVPGWT